MRLRILTLAVLVTLLAAAVGVSQSLAQTEPAPTEGPEAQEATEVPAEEPTEVPPAEEPTEVPQAEDPTEAPQEATTPEDEDDDGSGDDDNNMLLIFGLIAAGAVVLIAFIALLAGRGRKSSGGGPDWNSRASEAYGKAAALHDSIGVELAVSTPISDGPAARERWQDVQRRTDDLTADLHVLETSAKNEQQTATLRQMLASLAALRSSTMTPAAAAGAVEPPAPGQPSPGAQLAAQIRQRLTDFDGDVRALRALL